MQAKYNLVIGLCFLMVGLGFAKNPHNANFETMAHENYLAALNSKNDGVRNSAIFLVLQFKMRYPEHNMQCFIKKLAQISQKDVVAKNRIQAQLAIVYLQSPELMLALNSTQFQEPQPFFGQLYHLLAQSETDLVYAQSEPDK
ncbi:hypothetical protein L0128_01630 [candidate division KSB1 bacterium]|nr:hypothetical protein [candidate division KSB1 bacterium]